MKLSDHNNILRCYCSFVETNQLWLVLQLMDLGSCLRVMNISKSRLNYGEGLILVLKFLKMQFEFYLKYLN